MVSWTCKICSSTQESEAFKAKEMMFGFRDEFEYLQCKNCNALQLLDIPSDMSKYYPDHYYSFKKGEEKKYKGVAGLFRKWSVRAAVSKNPGSAIIRALLPRKGHRVFKGISINRGTRILDVGSGNGFKFLYPLAEIGFKNVQGCDPYIDESIDYENGLKVQKSELSEMSGKWDIITFHHSFEHISNPKETISLVSGLLEKGGTCIIRIPTVSSYAWEHYGVNWVQLDAPRHFFLHSVESMKLLAEQNDLKLDRIEYDSWHLQFTGSEKYIRDIPLRQKEKSSLSSKWKKRSYKKRAKALNKESRGDQAAFYLVKSD